MIGMPAVDRRPRHRRPRRPPAEATTPDARRPQRRSPASRDTGPVAGAGGSARGGAQAPTAGACRGARTIAATRRRRRGRDLGALVVTLVVLGLLAAGAYIALQSVYFIGTNTRGLVTLYQGVPYQLPGNIDLYSRKYVSGVSASTIPAAAPQDAARPPPALRSATPPR